MNNWTAWDWVGRIGMYLAVAALIQLFGWWAVALVTGILMVLLALKNLNTTTTKEDRNAQS